MVETLPRTTPMDQRNGNGQAAAPALSKNARKKLLKQQRLEARKAERKAAEKERKRQEAERRRREWEEKLAAAASEEERARLIESRRETRRERMEKRSEEREMKIGRLRRAAELGQKVVVDLEFAHLMTPNEIHSLVQQIMYCYAVNGRCASPAHLWLTGCRGEIETQLQRLPGFDKWIIEKESRPYIEALQDNKENLVYLTADAETILDELDPKKIYIIGGLVDRNRWKGITMKKANDQGIQSARLPIANYLRMSSSQVLTVNQVVEILLTFLETRDWKSAFFQVIPPRKRGEAEAEEVIEDEKTIDDADIVRVEDEVEGEDVDDEDIRVQKRQCIGESGTEGIEDENAEDSVRTVAASVDEAVNFEGNMHTKEATDGLRE
ncbi:tRNA (guanine(9)-N1)-methyltransferase isoform X1 [Elaeis guineensis]|uniref:tRNA (guanine(9)-N(1))-methyltransferase n=1 Tax=Elaeis guineensis var. tenera TaxID=51953 RepID=A0A6I9RKG2_ELAGV|nr:tRNA (guanine(9)-N1)-methyltransferase isoform X1 [Elaeis guineensis]